MSKYVEARVGRVPGHRPGDVFGVTSAGVPLGLFQFVAIDENQLGSAVVGVLSGGWNPATHADLDEIASRQVVFWCHLFLQSGIETGAWRRVGHTTVAHRCNTSFATLVPQLLSDGRMERRWRVWRVGSTVEVYRRIPQEAGLVEYGAVVAVDRFLERMRSPGSTLFTQLELDSM